MTTKILKAPHADSARGNTRPSAWLCHSNWGQAAVARQWQTYLGANYSIDKNHPVFRKCGFRRPTSTSSALRWAVLSTFALLGIALQHVGAQTIQETKQRLGAIAERAADAEISTYFFVGQGCRLLFVGTRHTFDPQAPIFKVLNANLDAFLPNLLVVEGGDWKSVGDAEETIKRQGEMGYLAFSGRQSRTETISFEPSDSDLSVAAKRIHHAEDVKLYLLLRMVPQWRDAKGDGNLQSNANLYLAALAGDKTRPQAIQDVDEMVRKFYRLDSDWRQIDPSMKIHGIESNTLKMVDTTINNIRNANLLEAISKSIREKKRVMVVAGNTHLAALVGQLNQFESSCLN